jgi:adenosylmethionine-8-amino-7-oxononanoate aminotransferase
MPVSQLPVPPYDASETEAREAADLLFAEHGQELAALIVEPLCQGAAGMRTYAPDFLRYLYALAQQHGVLFIADEIAVGMGRTGRMFAFEHAEIDPDMVCLGKGLPAGYLPLSATVVKDAVFDSFRDQPEDHTFYHGHTFAGNPIATAAALACLQSYEEERILEHVQRLAPVLAEALEPLRACPTVRDVRGLGLMGAVELESEASSAALPRPRRVQEQLHRDGILVRPLGHVLYLMPPLNISEKLLLEVARSLEAAIVLAR